jgi:hypothetical protein
LKKRTEGVNNMPDQKIDPTFLFLELTDEQLCEEFIAASKGPTENGNIFFNRFKFVYDRRSNPAAALHNGIGLLNKCHSIDQEAYAKIHKGSAYYWLGIAAWFAFEHELATFFFDAAVSEDLRAGHNASSRDKLSPSLLFMLLDISSNKQEAIDIVSVNYQRMDELINNYNSRMSQLKNHPPFLMTDLQQRFLVRAFSPGGENLRSAATTLISFCLEWDLRNQLFDIQPIRGTTEPYFLHLFKGCVLFETLLKANPINPPPLNCSLGPALTHCHSELGISPNINISILGFQDIINNLASSNNSIETAIQFTGQIRNTLGHNLGWIVKFEKDHYQNLFRMVSSSCLHAISCLY